MKNVIKTLVITMGMSVIVANAMAADVVTGRQSVANMGSNTVSSTDDDEENGPVGGGQPLYELVVTKEGKEVASLTVGPMMGELAEQNDFEAVPYVKSSTYDEITKKSSSEKSAINTGAMFRVKPSFCGDDSICTEFHISNVTLIKMGSINDGHGINVEFPESSEVVFEGATMTDLESLRKKSSVIWTSTSNGLTYTVNLRLT